MCFPHLTSSLATAVCDTAAGGIAGDEVAFCSALIDVSVNPEPQQWVRLIPMGVFKARDSRPPWVLNDLAHAEAVVAASQAYAGGTDSVVDYDHQSERALEQRDTSAPASGWFKQFQARADGVYGLIEWTDKAFAALKAKEYRYISPVFTHVRHGADGAPARVVRLMRAGLTNNPALTDLAAVAATAPKPTKEPGMTLLERLLAAIGLPSATTEDQALAACATLVTAAAGVRKIATTAGLAETAEVEAICTAIAASAAEPDASKFVPIAMFKDLQSQVAGIQGATAEERAVASVDAAIAAGKITPAHKDYWVKNAKADPAGFAEYVASAATIVTPGGKPPPGKQTPASGEVVGLTGEQKALCALMGWNEAAYLDELKNEVQA